MSKPASTMDIRLRPRAWRLRVDHRNGAADQSVGEGADLNAYTR